MYIYNITAERRALFAQIEELDGEITPEIEEQLTVNKEILDEVVIDSVNQIKEWEGDIVAIDAEIKRLQSIKNSKSNSIIIIKEFLKHTTEQFGEEGKTGNKKLKYPTFQMYTTNRESVECNDEEFEHPDFTNYTLKTKVDSLHKKSIEDVLEDAEFVKVIDKTLLNKYIKGETPDLFSNNFYVSNDDTINPFDLFNSDYFFNKESIPEYITNNRIIYKYDSVLKLYIPIVKVVKKSSLTIK